MSSYPDPPSGLASDGSGHGIQPITVQALYLAYPYRHPRLPAIGLFLALSTPIGSPHRRASIRSDRAAILPCLLGETRFDRHWPGDTSLCPYIRLRLSAQMGRLEMSRMQGFSSPPLVLSTAVAALRARASGPRRDTPHDQVFHVRQHNT